MKIEKSTLQFLNSLSANNNKDWFLDHKLDYESAKNNVLNFAEEIINIISAIDPAVPATYPVKKAVLRIYRDIRFSKNKDPYKQYFGIWVPSFTNLASGPGYYLHIQPNQSFLGAGYWMPSGEHLKLIRQELDYNSSDFINLISEKYFSSNFKFNFENALKRAPIGYSPDHELMQYLKLKSFEVSKPYTDEQLIAENFVHELQKDFQKLTSFIAFIRTSITI
ncbi:DUF2461 domain-containing protein [Pedobacter flavus]|uniref:DUF2461 domain-containing protein n=1 Tax=Pedobacter flavus TaxID=3113906 RepID=A0ABU7GYJ0_9SPHI|nr:DUF2461 domain-containing protein [Pedobacter sp. VNH31]MEE1884150.1 DUF2461 domain-containing protein [Pedobacter sp. VNH31]